MSAESIHLEQQSTGTTPLHGACRRRDPAVLLLTIAGAAIGGLSFLHRPPALVWNATESVPVGLYRVSQGAPAKGDLIAIAPTGAARKTLAEYDVLPADKLLLKRLAAIEGDVVCRRDTTITVNNAVAAVARLRSTNGRELPAWGGCHTLAGSQILVLAPHPFSFDGRYLGPTNAGDIVGVADPLFVFKTGGRS